MTEPEHSAEVVYEAEVEERFDPEDEWHPEPEPLAVPPSWCDGSLRVGIHTSIAGDMARSLDIAYALGCNALQIFSSSPRMWPRPGRVRVAEADAKRFVARRVELGLGPLAIHANYLINLAANEPVARVRAIQAFRDELIRAIALGADFLIIHPGSAGADQTAQGSAHSRRSKAIAAVAEAIRQAARGLSGVLDRETSEAEPAPRHLQVLLENTAGMGSSLGARLGELAAILSGVAELDLGICLDTAHLFQAGYAIHTEAGLEHSLQQIDETLGLDRVKVVHVNDSKTAFGSRVDRHEHLGRGKIGTAALRRLLRHPSLSPERVPGRAFLLETPIDKPGDDRRNVAALWKMLGAAAKQPAGAVDGFSPRRRKKTARTKPHSSSGTKPFAAKGQRARRRGRKSRAQGGL